MKVIGVVGWKNSGKTGLVERLVAEISGRGVSVSTIKHAHHSFDVDQPGRDSFRHRQAGAKEVVLSSFNRWAIMHELRGGQEPGLQTLLGKLSPVDLVIVEGFKAEPIDKIECIRSETDGTPLWQGDSRIVAIASDNALADVDRPVFELSDTAAIAEFVMGHTGIER